MTIRVIGGVHHDRVAFVEAETVNQSQEREGVSVDSRRQREARSGMVRQRCEEMLRRSHLVEDRSIIASNGWSASVVIAVTAAQQ